MAIHDGNLHGWILVNPGIICSRREKGIRKPSLNPDNLANYRPISNLSFVSKLLERAVHAQLLMYLNENELLPSVQSAYRQFFSTETAVT